MEDEAFLSEQHGGSRRWAVVEDDGESAWLYLTASGSQRPVADCWLYNRDVNAGTVESRVGQGLAPPAPRSVTGAGAVMSPASSDELRLEWSADGESAAVHFGETLLGFIARASKPGYSRHLIVECPWGRPLDEGLYRELFGGS